MVFLEISILCDRDAIAIEMMTSLRSNIFKNDVEFGTCMRLSIANVSNTIRAISTT